MPPTVYVETSVISLLASRPSRDVVVLAHQQITHDFWMRHRRRYRMTVSELVMQEIERGDADAAARRAELVRGFDVLVVDERARILTNQLVRRRAIPAAARADAVHVAIATVHATDYLVTWNLRHIADAAVRRRIEIVCRAEGYEPPVLCTPEELMGEFEP